MDGVDPLIVEAGVPLLLKNLVCLPLGELGGRSYIANFVSSLCGKRLPKGGMLNYF